MPFVTKLRLQSGDRTVLDGVVSDIKETAARKGAKLKGPHPKPPTHRKVPLYKRADADGTFDTWDYTVYTRTIEIVGHDEFARTVTEWSFPDSVHITAEIDPVRQANDG
ncbi:MAG: small subunit ribosomal protein S10 [Haloarculaceae archaeon]|jgi:small subunit ribosomal protein S10